ncbi:protein kinase [bacterium]|nr:protein kinase [bacterium]
MNRVPAPGAQKGPDGRPASIVPDGTLLKETYRTEFLTLGGMSVVYRVQAGEQVWLAKEVAAQDPKGLVALSQEKALLERLDHPSIVKSHEMFEEDGYYYLIREYVEGQTLEQQMPAEGFLEPKLVLEWALRLCNVLGYLHSQNPPVIYRDLKPKNVLKDENGKLMLFDFGIARSFKEGKSQDTVHLGSALTASPEHYGGQTDARSDLYTLGATLHYLLTSGKAERENPFVFPSVRDINPQVSEAFAQVIAGCLERKPEDRFQSATELAQALLECNAPANFLSPPGPVPGARAFNPSWAALPLALLLGYLLWPRSAPNQAPNSPTPVSSPSPMAEQPLKPKPVERESQPPPLTPSPSLSPTLAPKPVPAHPSPRPASPGPQIRPQIENPEAYPQAHPQTSPTQAPPGAEEISLPPALLDASLTEATVRAVSGPRDAQGTWVEWPEIRFRLPPGYGQISEGVYVSGQGRRFRFLAVRPLAGRREPEEYAALLHSQLNDPLVVAVPRSVGSRPAQEITFRRPVERRILVGTEIYTTAPNGGGWCISAGSARIERPELKAELESLLSSISF